MSWRPAHATHAIERVNLTLAFQEQVPSRVWQPLIEEATRRFQEQGFGLVPVQPPVAGFGAPGVQILINAAPGPTAEPIAALHDRAFLLMDGAQPREEAQVGRHQITYGVNAYQSWKLLSDRITGIFKPLVDKSLELTNLSLLKIECWDRFNAERDTIDYSLLINASSGHIPSFIFATEELFHSHSGYFIRQIPTKRLININIDSVDLNVLVHDAAGDRIVPRRSVGIYTMAQDLFMESSAVSENFDSALSKLDEMHSILKELLGDVITGDMSKRIGLFEGGRG